jgi:tetratricopeptide (TPR) repeat protein
MRKVIIILLPAVFFLAVWSCNGKVAGPSEAAIEGLHLDSGKAISCGPPEERLGDVEFETSCSGKERASFNRGIELLHSFEYEEAEKAFAAVIRDNPACAMAYWGVAMCNYHLLWTPPSEPELKKGAKAIELARSIGQKSKRESDYIEAAAPLYESWDKVDHHTRCARFEKAMEKLHTGYPNDKEAAIFYALSLDASADPADKSYVNQKKAGAILMALYPGEPNHPGITHYIIHTFDFPGLAEQGLAAAHHYADIAPSSAHALHMPSHIFTRLGLWDESIRSNLASVASARCYAESAGFKGHWDEELHGLDYLVYAYLQKGEKQLAAAQCQYLQTIKEVHPANAKVAYAFAAIPARYALENHDWAAAAVLPLYPQQFPWEKFPWQKAMNTFTRLLGAVHTGRLDSARQDLLELHRLHDTLAAQKDGYKATEVQIQINAGEGWISFKEGKNADALRLMTLAAEMEDKTEKNPVTPCEVIPARELLGDMLLEMNKPQEALQAFEADLKTHPNRLNGLNGVKIATSKK